MTTTEARPAPVGYRDNLTDGLYFRLHAQSVASITGYQPPSTARDYARALAVLAKGAALGDRQAELVSTVVRAMPALGLEDRQIVEKMYRAAEARLASPFVDIGRKASPEPGRSSDWTHDWSVADAATLAVTLHEAARCFIPDTGIGWALAAVLDEEGCRTIRGEVG